MTTSRDDAVKLARMARQNQGLVREHVPLGMLVPGWDTWPQYEQLAIDYVAKCDKPETPLLGLATTRDLLTELAARGRVEAMSGSHWTNEGRSMAGVMTSLLGTLPVSMLDYRTVDEPPAGFVERAAAAAVAYTGPEGWTFRDEEPPTKQPMLRDHTRGHD